MIEERPNPDQLLKRIQEEEKEASSAKLKIFFGPYPGVGKTYAMLEAARERQREGVDVISGIVETHGRPETTALLKDMEVLPRKEISYKGITLHEFDLDAALARKPDLIVVDELAHTNAGGSRHAKRWQDVEELLRAGVSVYTTLNVQHWESLNDVIAQITGVKVRETVPDSFLQQANEIELVDLPPADLLKRLSEGKVYIGEQAIRASENFFQTGNLIALRELALRHTAERVDAQMQEFKNRYSISKVLPVRERLLVGITASPHSARLVRATLRLATSLRCEWITVYVQTPEHEKLPEDQKARVIDTLRLAERLGGETAILSGHSVANELLEYARSRNVTKIVLGKPSEPRWKEFLFGSTVNEIARGSAEVDLYVISTTNVADQTPKRYAVPPKKKRAGYLQGILLVVLCTVLCRVLLPFLDRANLILFYFLAVVWISYGYGRPAGIVASVLSVLLFDYFLVPPYYTFAVSDTQYLVTFAIMLFVALFISTLTGRLVALANAGRAREGRLRSLYKLSSTLSEIPDPNDMLLEAWQQLEDFFNAPVLLMTPDTSGRLRVAAGDRRAFGFHGNDVQTAEWVYRQSEPAGRGTDTLAGSTGTYFPLKGREKTVGVLAIRMQEEPELIEPEQWQLLEKVTGEIGGALESKELSEAAGRATASMEAERLKNFVLRSFSYDLAAPSQEIIADAQSILNLAGATSLKLKYAAYTLMQKADRMNRVVERLPNFLQEVFPTASEASTNVVASGTKMPEDISLCSVLAPDRIFFFTTAATKSEIFKCLVNSLHTPDPPGTLHSIEEREESGGILIRPNVAIPHTMLSGINGVTASLGIQDLDEDEISGRFFWLLFVSGSESIKEHLSFLRSVARTMTEEVLVELSGAETRDDVLRIICRQSGKS
jgi:two-component system sensor histidine kinase KdpD